MYLYNLINVKTSGNYPLKNVKEIPVVKVKHRFIENAFFPQDILTFICLNPRKDFDICNPHVLKL